MTERHKTRRYIAIFVTIFVFLLVIGYTLYEFQRVANGPRITVTSPKNGALISTSGIAVVGTAQNISDISLNDRKIFIDEEGNFNEKVFLSYGYNTIVLKATDRFGQKTEKILELIYK